MSVQSYQDLTAWQRAMDLVEAVYRATQSWPREELYGLTNQARRAAVSVPANIAEGKGRFGPAEFLHHLSMATGSLHETETHLLKLPRVRSWDSAVVPKHSVMGPPGPWQEASPSRRSGLPAWCFSLDAGGRDSDSAGGHLVATIGTGFTCRPSRHNRQPIVLVKVPRV
jgi:four helix bundle protein